MIGDRSGYVTGGTFILVAVDKHVANKCCCSASDSSGKCYLCYEAMGVLFQGID